MSDSLTAALDRVTDGIAVLAADWTCVYLNEPGARLLGRDVADLVGRNAWTEFPAGVGTRFREAFQRAFDTQQPVEFESVLDPLATAFAVRVYPSPDSLTLYFRDVTSLRALERARDAELAAAAEAHSLRVQFRALLEASEDYIGIADLNGRALYLNPGGRALIGLDPDRDIATLTIDDLLPPEWIPHAREVEVPALRRDGHWSGEHELLDHRGGPPIPVRVSSFLLHDLDSAEPVALATVQRDIREERAVNERLRTLAEQRRLLTRRLVVAQEDERARIATEVHDGAVQALAAVDLRLAILQRHLARAGVRFDDAVRHLQNALALAADRLRDLLFDLDPDVAERPFGEVLREATMRAFEHSEIRWSVEAGPGIVIDDVGRAQALRIAGEALGNARSHADATAVTVRVVPADGGIEVEIADDGKGIDPAAGPAPGHRGLTSMRDRAEIAGGWQRIERGPDGGTVVRFWLPTSREPVVGPA